MENSPIFNDFIPGALVKCPSQPSWGIGQVQSCINGKVTINFENVGKKSYRFNVHKLRINRKCWLINLNVKSTI